MTKILQLVLGDGEPYVPKEIPADKTDPIVEIYAIVNYKNLLGIVDWRKT